MDKVDFKKTLDSYRATVGEFRVVNVPERRYLMIDGHGDPNVSPAYVETLESLYPVAYKMKFASKQDLDRDYVVPPLEGLWWAEDMAAFTTGRDKSQWDWTMMLMVPDWVGHAIFVAAVEKVGTKNPPPRLEAVRLEALTEGQCVQTLHLGSFDDEAEVLANMHDDFIPSHGLQLSGKHHEIYLSDPRKTIPTKLRTILRQPVSGDYQA
jgi:hypothetical protein